MQTVPVTISREEAQKLYNAYLKHKHYSTPIDDEVMSAYQKLAAGKTVIQALASVASAGVGDDGLPKLALARADAKFCQLRMRGDGSATMTTAKRARAATRGRISSTTFDWVPGTFQGSNRWRDAESIVPPVPLHLRPNRAMENYTILYEAEWKRAVPVDPFLLRRIGKADLWLVLAHWNLTSVEAAALSARL